MGTAKWRLWRYNGAFVNMSWDRSTRHRAHPKRNALGGKVLAGTFLSHMAGRSLPFYSPVRFLFVSFPSHGKSADLCSASWAWLRPWLSTPGSVSTWSAAVFTGPVSLTAQPSAPSWRSTDDLEGREACRSRSCSWLFTGARQRLAVDVFPRSGGFRGVADFVHGKMDGMHVWSFEAFPRTRAFVFTLLWLFCILASRVFNFFSSDRHFSSDNFSFGSSWPFYFFFIFVFSRCLFCLPRQSWWKFSACHPVRDAMRNKTKLPWNLYYFKSNWYDLRNSQRPHLKIWARKREGERRSDLNDTNIALPAGGHCGRRGEEGLADFFQLWAFFRVCSRAIFASKLSVQLLRVTENTSRYVDRWGYQQTKNNLCSKMPPTANLRIFLHKSIAGSLTWTAFPRGWVPLVPLETFLQKTKGKV